MYNKLVIVSIACNAKQRYLSYSEGDFDVFHPTGWHVALLMWEIGRGLGHYGDHPCPRVADRGTPSRVDKKVAPDREGAADKQCQGEGKLWSQYVITNRE